MDAGEETLAEKSRHLPSAPPMSTTEPSAAAASVQSWSDRTAHCETLAPEAGLSGEGTSSRQKFWSESEWSTKPVPLGWRPRACTVDDATAASTPESDAVPPPVSARLRPTNPMASRRNDLI